MAKIGRPKKDTRLTIDDLLDAEGNPINPNYNSKDQNARRFQAMIDSRDANEKQGMQKGMYAGMANPESYLEFYKISTGKPRKGRPWTYPDAKMLETEILKYFEFCIDKRIPVTVAGLSAWLGISVSTLSNWKRNRDTMPYYEVVEPAVAFIHAMTEQGAVDGNVPTVTFIFLSKNYNGLKDSVEYDVSPNRLNLMEQEDIVKKLPQ